MNLFAADSLMEIVHGRVRLSLLSFLSTVEEADFVSLREIVGIKDGHLSQQLKKLEDAGYIEITRVLVDGKTRTTVAMTSEGRRDLQNYFTQMRRLMDNVPATKKTMA